MKIYFKYSEFFSFAILIVYLKYISKAMSFPKYDKFMALFLSNVILHIINYCKHIIKLVSL